MRSSTPCQELLYEANAKTEFGKNLARHYGVPEAAKEKNFAWFQLARTRTGSFDYANGNGHTKEFRPTFFGVGAGESTALMIVTFIAGQHKNVANIEFEFDVKVRGFGCAVWSTLSIVYNDLARHFRGRSVI